MKKILKVLIILILILILYYSANELIFTHNNYDKYITNSSEINDDKIEEYISKGMKVKDYISAIKKESNYIDSKKEYEKINYNFEKHYTYNDLEKIYKDLNKSEIVKLEVIGKSFDEKNIYSIEIGNGKDIIMLEGNIHAAEIASVLFLTKYGVDLVNDWEQGDINVQKLLKKHKIVIVPTINPDGYDYSLFGIETIKDNSAYVFKNDRKINQKYYKANLNGIDINRNFPTETSGLYFSDQYLDNTVSKTKSTEMYQYFPGEKLGSEPETKAMIYWIHKHYKNAHAYLSIHSAGRVIYNGKQYLSDEYNKLSQKCAEIINDYTYYKIMDIETDDGYGTDGTSTDMIAELVHGFKFSKKTGRLSTDSYGSQNQNLEKELCVLTIETLDNYSQNLKIIKEEYYNKKLKEAFNAIVDLKF